ncbi:hypothetical protein MNEG_0424 [Monoraphidium neglectum]|uniref:Uncharacterized protein n=1 Tax=Monoraphidium neglectum TaxID=145388 RepID=A0A0D2MYI1_9CHLO|nr:hypothetical protein MNEG_0424 [Monoraphidium neglectum]KIZ07535.1 hypothetical protein MNEG_0424 [Monoraphidium neglectum]|eukprot:XP_013906554.1 hypothetical protein MNEG_0424 [Monoraphidium neglectum]
MACGRFALALTLSIMLALASSGASAASDASDGSIESASVAEVAGDAYAEAEPRGVTVVLPREVALAAAKLAANTAAGLPPSNEAWLAFAASISASLPPELTKGPPENGTVAQMWAWWDAKGRKAPARATPAFKCLAEAFEGAPRDKKVYSQYGEDGIIETIFSCIKEKNKDYVEFGTEDASECTTRYLRTQGWTGLLMDGSHENADINLHTEYMRSENIVDLFKKYNVSHPVFDHLTADIDLNTFWVLRAILDAGYRPRSVAIEYNRNFHPNQAYTTLDMPQEVWAAVSAT